MHYCQHSVRKKTAADVLRVHTPARLGRPPCQCALSVRMALLQQAVQLKMTVKFCARRARLGLPPRQTLTGQVARCVLQARSKQNPVRHRAKIAIGALGALKAHTTALAIKVTPDRLGGHALSAVQASSRTQSALLNAQTALSENIGTTLVHNQSQRVKIAQRENTCRKQAKCSPKIVRSAQEARIQRQRAQAIACTVLLEHTRLVRVSRW